MDIQLFSFWLRPYYRLTYIALTTTPQLPSNLTELINYIMLFDYNTQKQACSGDILTLRTDDPQERPLPSKEL
ncbi:hypothetical protein C8Q69DRAFT_462928 [Paecilomyces variotii]|uniref:Uncharacterized protein n=1 Tax=Byssochlamys spectabilis TaxID=264951 RepID=A0A443HZK3_BYSSP|nr:hypothetical protein C8Q69DRAFT_462928 [Paecilomyces variotii]RWQ97246.1 hypothetical protein C8Q69DRAFT_462928 [Paecilomyces variotii]